MEEKTIDIKELYSAVFAAKTHYDEALATKSGIRMAESALMNTMFNRASDILAVIGDANKNAEEVKRLKDDLESLEVSLDDADRRYAELKASIETAKKKGK